TFEDGRMYYKNYFALYSHYSGPLWKNHPQQASLKCNNPSKLFKEEALSDWMLPLYRHQALVEQPTLRLGFPAELLKAPILLINPFPPMDEWSSPSLLDR